MFLQILDQMHSQVFPKLIMETWTFRIFPIHLICTEHEIPKSLNSVTKALTSSHPCKIPNNAHEMLSFAQYHRSPPKSG